MKIDPINESAISINSTGIGTVTRAMVRLALINGRAIGEVSKSDWEQTKRELTGGAEIDPQEALFKDAPESERWDPLPGSSGQIATVPSSDGDDEDRKSIGERLIDRGVEEAEHNQILQAAEVEEKKGL